MQTVESLIENLEMAYQKLSTFHKDAANGISTKRVEKNIIKKEHIHLGSFSSPVF